MISGSTVVMVSEGLLNLKVNNIVFLAAIYNLNGLAKRYLHRFELINDRLIHVTLASLL